MLTGETPFCFFISPSTMAAQQRGRFGALVNDRNLRRFVVEARETGRHLGTGSYGAVEEVWLAERERYSTS